MPDASSVSPSSAKPNGVAPASRAADVAAHPAEASATEASSTDARVGLGALLQAFRRGGATDQVRAAWRYLQGKPFGRKLFSRIIGMMAPYSGSIDAEVLELEQGHALVQMRDRRRLRNHLRCLHAIALSNLAEYTGNVALAYSIPGDARFIVTRMQMEYLRKARGVITAECRQAMPTNNLNQELQLVVELRDAHGATVARGTLSSLVGPASRRDGASHSSAQV